MMSVFLSYITWFVSDIFFFLTILQFQDTHIQGSALVLLKCCNVYMLIGQFMLLILVFLILTSVWLSLFSFIRAYDQLAKFI